MKTTIILRVLYRATRYCTIVVFAICMAYRTTSAQSAVTAVFTHTKNATTATTYSGTGATGNAASGLTGNTYTYHFGTNVAATNNISILDSFTAYALNYHYQPAGYNVKFRRVDNASVTGLRKSFRIEQNGGTVAAGGNVDLYPDYDDSLERVFTQRIFNVGIDNVFQNATTTNNANVEREDVIFPGGVKATDNTKIGFVVFDWGTSGGHDPFYIAAIKTLDASGNPASYYAAVSVTAANYGSNVGGNATYIILRKNPADARLLMMNNSTSQNRDGVFLRFNDLGVGNNTLTYGYSLFSTDATVTPVIKMVDYTNASNFPTGTDLSGGGVDPLAVAGLWVTNASYVLLPERVDELQSCLVGDNRIKLSWNLAATDNLLEQVMERSTDGSTYTRLLNLPVGNAGPQTALDMRPMPGKNYYRLKLVQQDGTVAAYSTVSRTDIATPASLYMDVYPNPVTNRLVNLDIRGLGGSTYDLLLLDMNGRPAIRHSIGGLQDFQQPLQLPQDLPAGAYTLQLTNNAGNKVTERRIVVN